MITVKLEGFQEALAQFDSRVVRQAARAAIDRATASGKSAASEEIRKVWNVKKADLDPRIKITPPRMSDLTGQIDIYGRGMSLSYFGAKQIMGSTVRSRVGQQIRSGKLSRRALAAGPMPVGIMVEILKGQNTTLFRNAFLAKVKAGKVTKRDLAAGPMQPGKGAHIGVFYRSTKSRLPIYEKQVISVAAMAGRPEVMKQITDRITERWVKEFPHQLDYFMKKAGK